MTLYEYVKKLFTKGPELWVDTQTVPDPKTKATVKRDTGRLRRCSLGIVSCDSAEEWYLICRRECPAGTIIEEFEKDAEKWNELFQEVRILVRADLTRSLLQERNTKGAKTLMDVMERRDKDHWAKAPKAVEASAVDESTGKTMKVSIVGI